MSKHTSKSDAVLIPAAHSDSTTNLRNPKAKAALEKLEIIITDNFQSGFKLAAALAQIRDQELYLPEYKSFEEYGKKRWGYSRSYCHRLCDVNGVLTDLSELPATVITPKNEAQARIYVNLEKDERIQLAEKITEEADGQDFTAALITKFKKELFPDKCVTEPKKTKPSLAVIDVEATVEVQADRPKLTNIWQTVVKMSAVMLDEEREGVLGQLIQDLMNEVKPWIESAENLVTEEA